VKDDPKALTSSFTFDELGELDRNARAYGFEIGRGKKMEDIVSASEDNPFLHTDWAERAGLK
jgi:hypothetical protein